jgi:STIP1 family protein 1
VYKLALDLAKEKGMNFADEVMNVMRLARKKKWALSEEKRLQQEIELQTDLNILLAAEKDRLDSPCWGVLLLPS